MTVFNPIWKIEIAGVDYTNFVLANLTIQSGRPNIYEQSQAGYCSMTLLNVAQSQVNINPNDNVTIFIKDSADVFVPIFGGSVSEISISVTQAGSSGIVQNITLMILGGLSKLQKALTDGVLSQELDGEQISDILTEVLLNQWNEVPAAMQWNSYFPITQTWEQVKSSQIGEIDTGIYELAARSSLRSNAYQIVSDLATSGFGYIYESGTGQISYAGADHRSIYLSTNGYSELDANQSIANGLAIQTKLGDVRNSITIQYGANSNLEVSASDAESISSYGELGSIVQTTLKHLADATTQANKYLAIRSRPFPNLYSVNFQLTNPELDDLDRDSLIKVFMGLPLRISNLPLNMSAGTYSGFVESWTFSAAYNELSVTAFLSPLSYTIFNESWQEVNPAITWTTVAPLTQWEFAFEVV
jgi:hypothetical protein